MSSPPTGGNVSGASSNSSTDSSGASGRGATTTTNARESTKELKSNPKMSKALTTSSKR